MFIKSWKWAWALAFTLSMVALSKVYLSYLGNDCWDLDHPETLDENFEVFLTLLTLSKCISKCSLLSVPSTSMNACHVECSFLALKIFAKIATTSTLSPYLLDMKWHHVLLWLAVHSRLKF